MSKRFSKAIRDEWKERVVNQKQSGLSIASWCRQNNITPYTFYYWRDQFFSDTTMNRADFKELSEQPNLNPLSQKSGLSLQYQAFCIHLDQQFDVATLKQCLKALKEFSC